MEGQKSISVLDPISPAIAKVKEVLFSPFDIGKWFLIGFCAFLANLCKGGGSSGGSNFWQQRGNFFEVIKDFFIFHLIFAITLVSAGAIVVIGIWLVVTWLNSRGQFMFLHCVAENKGEVKVPWNKFQRHGNSVFVFRVVVGVISGLAIALPIGGAALIGVTFHGHDGMTPLAFIGLLVLVPIILSLVIILLLIKKFTTDFVIPIMLLRTTSCVEGWRQFLVLLKANKGSFALYILFQIVIGMAIGMITIFLILTTCCMACCFLIIPYIGTVLMLPISVFLRSYSLCYLGQFGAEFDCFAVETEAQVQEEITE